MFDLICLIGGLALILIGSRGKEIPDFGFGNWFDHCGFRYISPRIGHQFVVVHQGQCGNGYR